MKNVSDEIKELITDLYDELTKETDLSPQDKILFKHLEFVIMVCDRSMNEIETADLVENITRDGNKLPFYKNNNFINIYDDFFNKMMRLMKSFHLTQEQKVKLKTEEKQKVNRLQSLRDKYK